MSEFLIPILMILSLMLIITCLKAISKNTRNSKLSEDLNEYKDKYMSRNLMSTNEKIQYFKIKTVTDKMGLHLFAKVRLADIIEPRKNVDNWKRYWNKVQSKHVDFFVCNKSMTSLCVIEIDDNSHKKEDRKSRDKFVDYILLQVGIETVRFLSVNNLELQNKLNDIIYKRASSSKK